MQQSASCHENELPQLSFPQTKSPSHSLFLSQSPWFIWHGLLLVQQSLISDFSPPEHLVFEYPELKIEIHVMNYSILVLESMIKCLKGRVKMYSPSALA